MACRTFALIAMWLLSTAVGTCQADDDAHDHDHDGGTCAAQQVIDALKATSSEYAASIEHEDEHCDEFVASVAGEHRFCKDLRSSSRGGSRRRRRLLTGDFEDPIYIMPIIFHVLQTTEATAIPDSQIDSQIDVINDDFRSNNFEFNTGLNDDLWDERVGDSRMVFVKQAVYRYDMPDDFECKVNLNGSGVDPVLLDARIKRSDEGGVDSIEPAQFLNFWVCDLTAGIAGYALFPCVLGQDNEWRDGVVQDYRTVGSKRDDDGTFQKYSASSRDYGRTGTHEIGHYLNLKHIWGSDGCDVGDDIADTPLQDTPNSGCPDTSTDSCEENDPEFGFDLRDMYENIMDYTSDECRFMFTEEQATHMRAVVEDGGCRDEMWTQWTPPQACDHDPCKSWDAGSCKIYHSHPGCDQCDDGSFKRDYDYPCVGCVEAFGPDCLHCADFDGCSQCTTNTHNLVRDEITGLWYCEPTPCYYSALHCRVCNNDECNQCDDGYTLSGGACY